MKTLFAAISLALCCASQNVLAALPIQSWTLDNGARVLFVENHSIPILDLNLDFDAGTRRDPKNRAGLAELTNAMLARGVRGKAAEPPLTEAQISNAFADTAAERGGGAGIERSGVSLRTLSGVKERSAAIGMLARVVAQPSFPQALLQRDKARTIAAIKEALTKPEELADKAFWKQLYGTHPYAYEATAQSVAAITRDDVVAFHRHHYVANRLVISMIGDVSRTDAEHIAQQLTARLPQGAALPPLPEVKILPARQIRIAHPASQAHILLGVPALTRTDPDYFPLLVGNYVLGGGGFVSRLTQEVREKRGLTYGVYSSFNAMAQKGPFQISLQTKKDSAKQALQVVDDTVAVFLRDGPTAAELQAAKDNLIGGFPLRLDNNRKVLANIALIGFYQLPLDYLDTWTVHVQQVTLTEVRAAFARKLALDQLSTVMVGAAPTKP